MQRLIWLSLRSTPWILYNIFEQLDSPSPQAWVILNLNPECMYTTVTDLTSILDSHRMTLSIKNILVQANNIRLRKSKVEILQNLRKVEANINPLANTSQKLHTMTET